MLLLEVSADIKIIYLIYLINKFSRQWLAGWFCVRFMVLESLVSLTFSAGLFDCKNINIEEHPARAPRSSQSSKIPAGFMRGKDGLPWTGALLGFAIYLEIYWVKPQ